jgi:hypothetical protein
MSPATLTNIGSVLVEARTWRDGTFGNNYTAAYLWVNGRPIGSFGFQYGSPEMLEHYEIEPYLEAVGVLPPVEPGTYAPHLRYRLKALGVDYYLTQSTTLKRGLWKVTELPEPGDFADAVPPAPSKISEAPAKDPNSGGRQNAGL